ncbi:MAG: Planctomycete cytochrome [Verrucomicrobiales bacterium]|nr:Planctomycete cytochrome [Verrucomicrobiales bacterium]
MIRVSFLSIVLAAVLLWSTAWTAARAGAAETSVTEKPAVKAGIDFEAGRRLWSLQPVGHPHPPVLTNDSWSLGAVDRFILERLRQAGLEPAAAADRRTLIRRATFDLTGLPPENSAVEAFLQDPSPDPEAFAKAADGLLASPQYGAQWARHWLDVARYSDTKGYVYAREEKQFVQAWRYRDWVVDALNADMPYDRFLLLQIAADQVEPERSPHLAAMGFLTLGKRFLGVTHDIIDDRIDVVMRSTQALTVACARCHDHKFDPISIRDYYSLYGVFKSSAEKLVPSGEPGPANAGFDSELAARMEKLRSTLAIRRGEQSARVRATIAEHLLAQRELDKYPDELFGQILNAADLNPVFVRRWQQFLSEARQRRDPVFAPWFAYAELDPDTFAAQSPRVTADLLSTSGENLPPLVARAFATAPSSLEEAAKRYGTLFAEVEEQWRGLLETDPAAQQLPDPNAESLRAVLHGPHSPCAVPDEAIVNIEQYFPTDVIEELWKLQGEVDRWLIQSADAPAHATILVDRTEPSTPRVFKRGNPLTKGDAVPRRFLEVMSREAPTPFSQGSGRLELARAIADPDNPLTARVMVNRVWAHHFGAGLVPTTSDFGQRAGAPSHPALLDWLARDFMDHGWSMKHLHRRILLSAAWQQSSLLPADNASSQKALETDPGNRLLWRMTPHRLSFEEMRDAWLAASGELDRGLGGKAAELWAGRFLRRTLYAFVDREDLSPVLRNFDFANPDLSIPQRSDTIVPQQALFSFNHPFPAARAKALTSPEKTDGADPAHKVRLLYQKLFQRSPGAGELEAALAFVQSGPPAATENPAPAAWQYGYGTWDEATGRIGSFTPLPHFDGDAWQGAEGLPNAVLGWAQLSAAGGHPGNDRQHAVVRRWTAPRPGVFAIQSELIHQPPEGDGIRAFISHGGRGLLRSTKIHHATEALNVEALPMEAGDTVDFIVDINEGLNSDQFLWAPQVVEVPATAAAGATGDVIGAKWDALKDFTGSAGQPLDAWQQLAQTLMLTNEFVFVD